jgi:hypothetical protein
MVLLVIGGVATVFGSSILAVVAPLEPERETLPAPAAGAATGAHGGAPGAAAASTPDSGARP